MLTVLQFFLSSVVLLSGAETVPVVVNTTLPASKSYQLVLTEDLRIEPDDQQEHTIWAGANVALDVDEKGHIFVTDPMSDRVIWFDEKGNLIKILGGKGEGPGQFRNLGSFQVLKDGSGIAIDNVTRQGRFHYFDTAMNFVSNRRFEGLDKILKSATFAPNGKSFSSLWVSVVNPEGYTLNQVGVLDSERAIQIPLSEDRNEKFNAERSRDAAYWVELIADHLSAGVAGMGRVAFNPDSSVYTAVSSTYEITLWSADRKKVRVIKKEYEPQFQSQEEIMAATEPLRDQIVDAIPEAFRSFVTDKVVEDAVAKANVSPKKHPIFALISMGKDGLLVLHDYSFLTKEGTVDIFSPEGTFLGSSKIPKINANLYYTEANRVVFKQDHAYFLETNLNDENVLVRYSYRLVPNR